MDGPGLVLFGVAASAVDKPVKFGVNNFEKLLILVSYPQPFGVLGTWEREGVRERVKGERG